MKVPSVKEIKNSKIANWIYDFCNTSWVAKIICLVLIWLVISIPFDLYLLVRWAIGPEGFWQEIAMMLVALIAIGWLQGLLLFFGIILSIGLILDEL